MTNNTINEKGLMQALFEIDFDRRGAVDALKGLEYCPGNDSIQRRYDEMIAKLRDKLRVLNLLTGGEYHYKEDGIYNGSEKINFF